MCHMLISSEIFSEAINKLEIVGPNGVYAE